MSWLETKNNEPLQARIYSQCKRVAEAAMHKKFGRLPPGFQIPPNPFSQRKGRNNWDRTDDIEDDEYRRIGNALIQQLTTVSQRLARARHLLPQEALRPPREGLSDQFFVEGDADSSNEDHATAFFAYKPLWQHLIAHRRLPKTAAVQELEFWTFDRYPADVTYADLGIEPDRPGKQLTRTAISLRASILEVALLADIPLNQSGADMVGLDLHQLRTQSQALIERGALQHVRASRKSQQVRETATTRDELYRYDVALGAADATLLGMQDQLRVIRQAVPTHHELRCAFALTLLRTGWNDSTVADMKVDDWNRPHPIQGSSGTYVNMYSNKGRAGGRPQYAQSSTNRPFSAYDIVRRVLTWTEPLRVLLDQQVAALTSAIKAANPTSKMEMLVELRGLKRLRNRIWLTILDDGRIAQIEPRWGDLNEALKSLGVTRSNGKEVKFTQAMTRRAWAIFNYERSGANLLLTKLALGHSDFASVMAYIASQKELVTQRMKWVSLQKALLKLFSDGKAIRIAAKTSAIPADGVRLHFFQRSSGGVAERESPALHADGRLSFWPRDFFDQWERSLFETY